jgi:hypothetical protein
MAILSSGVVGTGHEAAVGEELFGRWEPFDAVDLGEDGEGIDLSDSRDP